MTNNTTRREIVDGLNRLSHTFERAAAIYVQIAASPTMRVLRRQAEQAVKLAPRLDENRATMRGFRAAEPFVRDLERLAMSKPTRWSPDFN
jgi:hypothetical protein